MKDIVLDEREFWPTLVVILRVTLPIVKLQRMLDSNKPVLGKVYDRMFLINKFLTNATGISWLPQVARIHSDRWEYLHSDFHSAAYALDPEFCSSVGELDQSTQEGLMRTMEKLALREVILTSADPEAAAATMTLHSGEVVRLVATADQQFAQFQAGDGPFASQRVILNSKIMAPAVWWRTYAKHLDVLQRFACTILAQVGSAGACERNWSIYGNEAMFRRDVKSDKLVYVKEAIALHSKLQNASYTRDMEDWEVASDADSQASSSQDLLEDLAEDEYIRLAR